MQLAGSTVPAHNLNLFQDRQASSSSSCRGSVVLSPSTTRVTTTTESTRKHLSKLEKLLQKPDHLQQQQQQPPPDHQYPSLSPVEAAGNHHRAGGKQGLLDGLGLNLSWVTRPETKMAGPGPGDQEIISPWHLQQLLSKSQEYSPRNNLGRRWREYHGRHDWAGLLDPLDENLRREVVRYGEFIQAAYRCFHSDPATSPDEPPSARHVALPDRSYRVTKCLYATPSICLPKWVDDVAPDLGWMTQRTSWVGYVAVCDDPKEIARMGRRDVVIALRGTATCLEWAENLRDLLVQIPGGQNAHGQAKVECGFLSLYKTCGGQVSSLASLVVEEIQRIMELYKGEALSITVTGHSLGAALALLVADEISTACGPEVPPVAVFSFGSPRVGNRAFANRIRANNVKVLRIVNDQDVITRVPGMFVSEGLDKTLRNSIAAHVLLDVLDNNMPWAYSHVGTELRVDTKKSPFLKPDADVACCHDLEAYLHLVDGFLSSNCPFRGNAKRSPAKLLHEQKSNVKKLYTSRAKDLRLNIDQREKFQMSSCLPSPS